MKTNSLIVRLSLVCLLLAVPFVSQAQEDAEAVSLPERFVIFDASSVDIVETETGYEITLSDLRNTYSLWTLLQTSLRYDAPIFVNAWGRVEAPVFGSLQSTEDVIEMTIVDASYDAISNSVLLVTEDAASAIDARGKLPAAMTDVSLTIALDIPFLNAIAAAFQNVRAEGPGVAFVTCATATSADECNALPQCSYTLSEVLGVSVGSCDPVPGS